MNYTPASKTGRVQSKILSPRLGYNLVAEQYDRTTWKKFWKRNEYPIVKNLIQRISGSGKRGRALDVGCGTGLYSRLLGSYFSDVVAVDISDRMIELAEQHSSGKSKIEFIREDFLEFRTKNKFDIILTARTMSHISNLHSFIK